jgi:predicted RNase H-like HicB family nuclease
MSTEIEPTITLTESEDWWVARDTETGVTSQGKTREAALSNLDEALAGYHGDGDAPSEDELREVGIDPANNTAGAIDESDIFE